MHCLKLGIIADVQYCDCENAYNYERTQERFYRNSINHLDNSINYFLSNDCSKVLQLGDLIDGKCKSLQNVETAMKMMDQRFNTDKFESFHVIGNHELYNFSRENLMSSFFGNSVKKYQQEKGDLHYYKVNLSSNVCLIVIDCYDISVLNKRENIDNDPHHIQAREILKVNNTNKSWNNPDGINFAKYVAFNGGIGAPQLHWMEQQFKDATERNQIVILAGHVPIVSTNPNPLCLLWNDDVVLEMIHRYPCVRAYICGHNHIGSVVKSAQFIHITMPGVIEAFVDQCPYGILEINHNMIRLTPLIGYWNEIIFTF